jgi:hypothetical protein
MLTNNRVIHHFQFSMIFRVLWELFMSPWKLHICIPMHGRMILRFIGWWNFNVNVTYQPLDLLHWLKLKWWYHVRKCYFGLRNFMTGICKFIFGVVTLYVSILSEYFGLSKSVRMMKPSKMSQLTQKAFKQRAIESQVNLLGFFACWHNKYKSTIGIKR